MNGAQCALLGEIAPPSKAIIDHLKLPDSTKFDISPSDNGPASGWTLAFYFPATKKIILKKGNTSVATNYNPTQCFDNRETLYISYDNVSKHMKLFNQQ